GETIFYDLGGAGGADKVKGGAGTTEMFGGLGRDTFIGGSGTSTMVDTGAGNVAFQFDTGLGGTDVVAGFNAAAGDYVRITALTWTASQFLAAVTVTGGNSFVDLAAGGHTTKIEFVGVTNLTAADFHG
ncbi:MAG TPA: hypothetical protein VKS60_25695, partial [Stellaceae bacterium]|nr:hypothetical protein [Stellaceae bacterium]